MDKPITLVKSELTDEFFNTAPREELVKIVHNGLAEFIQVGKALLALHDRGLYLNSHASFDEFLLDEFQISPKTGYRRMKLARKVAELPPGKKVKSQAEAIGENSQRRKDAGQRVSRVTVNVPSPSNPTSENEAQETLHTEDDRLLIEAVQAWANAHGKDYHTAVQAVIARLAPPAQPLAPRDRSQVAPVPKKGR